MFLEDMSRNKCFFFGFKYHMFCVIYPFVTYLLTLLCMYGRQIFGVVAGSLPSVLWVIAPLTGISHVGSEVLIAAIMKNCIFWDITPCNPLKVNRRFGVKYRLHLQGPRISRARNKLVAISSSATSIGFQRTTWRYIKENITLQIPPMLLSAVHYKNGSYIRITVCATVDTSRCILSMNFATVCIYLFQIFFVF
jgi:hypothetical protein